MTQREKIGREKRALFLVFPFSRAGEREGKRDSRVKREREFV
jgi:hypothetical protein